MKTKFTLAILGLLLVTSCASTKVIKSTEKQLNGNWQLTDVSFPGSSGFFDVTLFQTNASQCFVNSNWSFVANNNRGKVSFEYSQCDVALQNMVWSVTPAINGDFDVIIKLAEDEKASKQKAGSRWKLANFDANTMKWTTQVNFQNQPVTILLSFERI
jgi:hypothetical protein